MITPANCVVLVLCLLLFSCKQAANTEQEEAAFWNKTLIDSSYRLLYADKDTARALHHFDSVWQETSSNAIFPKAARSVMLANYHYFFTADNAATAKLIDAGLDVYDTPELQNRYPHAYVGLLLFGGHIAYRLSQYTKANDYYFRAKKLADAYLTPCEKTAFNYNIAMVLYRQQNFSQSLHYFNQAYTLQETCAPQTTAVVLQQQEIQSNIGLCHVQLKNYDSALVYFDKTLQIANRYKDSLGPATMDKIYGVIYGNRAQVALAKNRLNDAEQLCLQSIALNDREDYEVENARGVKLQLAEVYNQQKAFGKMADVLFKLSAVISQADERKQLEWQRLMASFYEQTGQKDSALHFFKQYFSLRNTIAEAQKRLTEADVARQLNEKEQERQIAVLKKDQHITLISLWVTIVFSLMFLTIMFLVYYSYRRNKKSLALSLQLNEEIKRRKAARVAEEQQRHKLITEAVIKAQESERSLIGLELHDNINQVLTTVKLHNEMVLEGIGDPKAILPKTLAYLQNCINEIRSLSKRLSAPTLGKISLEESVRDLIDSINLTSKVKITQQITGIENEALGEELHLGVYRILQEQLNNVIKHAEASEVLVKLQKTEGQLELCVTDNGKGFQVNTSKAGIGLMNMQTRAENLSGTFKLKSEPGRGCKIEVVIPCGEKATGKKLGQVRFTSN